MLKCTKMQYTSFPLGKHNIIKLFVTFNRTLANCLITKTNPTAAKQLDKPRNGLNATAMQFK